MLVDRSVDEVAGVRRAPAAAALVELDEPVALRVEPAPPARRCSRCRVRRGARPRACRPGCRTPPSRSTGRRRRRASPSRTARSAGTGGRRIARSCHRRRTARQPSAGREPDHRDDPAGLLRVGREVRQQSTCWSHSRSRSGPDGITVAVAAGSCSPPRSSRRRAPRGCAPTRASSATRRPCRRPRSRRRPRDHVRIARRSWPLFAPIESGSAAAGRRAGRVTTCRRCARISSIIAFSNASLSQAIRLPPIPPACPLNQLLTQRCHDPRDGATPARIVEPHDRVPDARHRDHAHPDRVRRRPVEGVVRRRAWRDALSRVRRLVGRPPVRRRVAAADDVGAADRRQAGRDARAAGRPGPAGQPVHDPRRRLSRRLRGAPRAAAPSS